MKFHTGLSSFLKNHGKQLRGIEWFDKQGIDTMVRYTVLYFAIQLIKHQHNGHMLPSGTLFYNPTQTQRREQGAVNIKQ